MAKRRKDMTQIQVTYQLHDIDDDGLEEYVAFLSTLDDRPVRQGLPGTLDAFFVGVA